VHRRLFRCRDEQAAQVFLFRARAWVAGSINRRKPRVLVVEDSQTIREMVSGALADVASFLDVRFRQHQKSSRARDLTPKTGGLAHRDASVCR
jgi:hypothetical protein